LLERIGDSENGAERSALFKEMSTELLAHARPSKRCSTAAWKTRPTKNPERFALEGTSEYGLIAERPRLENC
jgi:hypothetical protein